VQPVVSVENVSGDGLEIVKYRKNIRIELYTSASSTGLPPQKPKPQLHRLYVQRKNGR